MQAGCPSRMPGLFASSSGGTQAAHCPGNLCLGLHVHGSSGFLAFDFPVLRTITNETCSLDESESDAELVNYFERSSQGFLKQALPYAPCMKTHSPWLNNWVECGALRRVHPRSSESDINMQ